MRHPLLLALVLAAAPLVAQTPRTVDPGMTKAQVIATIGEPATVRSVSDLTFLFYPNACGRRCGMNDLVVLEADAVVDAIFRSPSRRYSGTSSSPAAIPPAVARSGKATVTPDSGLRMRPGPPNDTRPSLPLNPPAVRPAPPTKPFIETP